jgi:hypothetical protein
MKEYLKKSLILCAITTIVGCTIGNGRICGPQTPVAYCDEEAYQNLLHPKSYLEYWVKNGIKPSTRRDDSVDCGALDPSLQTDPDGYPVFSIEDYQSMQHRGEDITITEKRIRAEWQRCMLEKGYTISEEWMLLTDKY